MADKRHKEPDRLNRVVSVGEIAGKALDPLLRQRGFATSELIANWGSIVPAPYDRGVMPDRLKWQRKAPDAPADGATLYVRVDPVHALGFAHERGRIRDAINRYFGFFLVGEVRTAREPFVPKAAAASQAMPAEPDPEALRDIEAKVETVADPGLREALGRLGRAVVTRRGQPPR